MFFKDYVLCVAYYYLDDHVEQLTINASEDVISNVHFLVFLLKGNNIIHYNICHALKILMILKLLKSFL